MTAPLQFSLSKDDPWGKLREVAARLGVKPIDDDRQVSVCINLATGERYDVFELISAFLDRLDEAKP